MLSGKGKMDKHQGVDCAQTRAGYDAGCGPVFQRIQPLNETVLKYFQLTVTGRISDVVI